MAASSVARSATTPFPLNFVSKPSQSDRFPKTALNFDPRFKRCRIALALASLRSDDNDRRRNGGHGHNHLVGGALELDSSALEDFPYDIVSKDLHTLPRPLSSTHLSNSVSDGPRLRVAHQFYEGSISKGSEIQVEVAEFLWRNVQAGLADIFTHKLVFTSIFYTIKQIQFLLLILARSLAFASVLSTAFYTF